MDIYKEATGTLMHGHQTVGRTRRQLVGGKYDILKGVLLRMPGPATRRRTRRSSGSAGRA